jgi:myo-inositol-1(or 4)-monophosphatase
MKEPIVNIAVRAARAAGNIIIRALDRLDTVRVSEKSPRDYVTEIDHQAEKEIIKVIQKAYPTHAILSEECGAIEGKDPYTWIIDPLDGTRNFMHGVPHFAVSIGITYKGKLEHGVIYDPVRQELFTATRGRGTQLNERRVRVSKRNKLNECLLSTGFPYRESEAAIKAYTDSLLAILPICGDVRRGGSAALDLAYVACGRFDGFWELGLKPWDFAAGALMVKESGGLIMDFNGTEDFLQSGNIVTANPKLIKSLLKVVGPHLTILQRESLLNNVSGE